MFLIKNLAPWTFMIKILAHLWKKLATPGLVLPISDFMFASKISPKNCHIKMKLKF